MNSNRIPPHTLGRKGEELGVKYLKKKNYKIVERRFRLFRGEIDIIASHKNTLVFVEVKTRKNAQFGYPEESITPAKQKQIRKIAQGYLTINKLRGVECRFDVLSILYHPQKGYSIHHFQDAF